MPIDRRRLLLDVRVLKPDVPIVFDGFRGRALIDTGATVSGIGPRVIRSLDLSSYGKRPLGSATEERMVDYYLFRIGFEHDVDGGPAWPFLFERLDGFSWARDTAFDVILGMDVLSQCDLHLRGGAGCTLRFGES